MKAAPVFGEQIKNNNRFSIDNIIFKVEKVDHPIISEQIKKSINLKK